jgi:hypothetical protein
MNSRVHTTNPAEILCNSMVTAADKGVSINNKTYGYCHLFYANNSRSARTRTASRGLTLASPEHEQVGDEGEAENMSLL